MVWKSNSYVLASRLLQKRIGVAINIRIYQIIKNTRSNRYAISEIFWFGNFLERNLKKIGGLVEFIFKIGTFVTGIFKSSKPTSNNERHHKFLTHKRWIPIMNTHLCTQSTTHWYDKYSLHCKACLNDSSLNKSKILLSPQNMHAQVQSDYNCKLCSF